MRRLLAASALTAAVLVAGGCSTDGTDTASPGSSSAPGTSTSTSTASATPSAGGSAAGGQTSGNTREVCDAAQKSVDDAGTRFADAVKKVAQGDAGAQQARADAKVIFADWATALRTQAGRATDPNLKSALETYAAQVEKAGSTVGGQLDVNKFVASLNDPALTGAYDKLMAACG